MPDLEWHPAARTDLWEIIDYIAEDNPDAALAMLDKIESKVAQLQDNPKLYKQGRVIGTRELVAHPSYVVVYAETVDAITVLRVLHTARRWP